MGWDGAGWGASLTMHIPCLCPQALAEAGLVDEFKHMSSQAYNYLERTQILSTPASQVGPLCEIGALVPSPTGTFSAAPTALSTETSQY